MITTGIIREVGISKGSFTGNAYKVELNIFQTPGDNEKENYTYIANCSVAGGLYDSYEVGDKVFVTFLHNNKSLPVILGKIFQGNNTRDESRSFANLNRLKVGNAVELPENTSIGTTKWQEVLNLFDEIEILKNTTHPESDITVEVNSPGTLISNIQVDGEDKHKLIITKTTPPPVPDITVEVSDPSGTGTIVSNVAVDNTNKHKLIVTKITPENVLTLEYRDKLNAIVIDGDGDKILFNDGEYYSLDDIDFNKMHNELEGRDEENAHPASSISITPLSIDQATSVQDALEILYMLDSKKLEKSQTAGAWVEADGALNYYDETKGWVTLDKGTEGYVLTMGNKYPEWSAASSSTSDFTDVLIDNSAIGKIPLIVKAKTGTTAKLQSWKVNDDEKAYIDKDGFINSASGYKVDEIEVIDSNANVSVGGGVAGWVIDGQANLEIKQSNTPIMTFYETTSGGNPDAKVKIHTKTVIADLDFGGW